MKSAPDYADRSDPARLFWLQQTLTVYEKQANGEQCAAMIRDHARERLPAIRAEIERLEGPPLRVIDGGAR